MKYIFLLLTAVLFSITLGFKPDEKPKTEIRSDFKKLYDHYKVEGAFMLYDEKQDKFIIYNEPQTKTFYTPASTFKICNSLIGLETGVIKDENFIIPWDSVVRQREVWNKNTSLAEAYKNSTVWYYQELARRVGGTKMKYWLDKAQFGNCDTTGGIDMFWLTGNLRINEEQQIDFLRRLNHNQLPFSKQTVETVKKIMIDSEKSTPDYTLRAKTGLGDMGDTAIGWYVGFVETKGGVYYFANCIQTKNYTDAFPEARKEITYSILKELKIYQKKRNNH